MIERRPALMRLATFGLLGLTMTLTTPSHSAPGITEAIGDRIVRFHADAAAAAAMRPSLALQRAFSSLGESVDRPRTAPSFERERGGEIVTFELEPGTSLYGAGEANGPLLRNGAQVTCWNTDSYGFAGTSLYQSHPWVLGVRADGSSFGVLADTPARLQLDFRSGLELRALGPAFPVIVIERESPQAVLEALATLIGTQPLPPRWALGFHQCRYSYHPAQQVLEVARAFRDKRIPCDAIWYDIDYMQRFRSFSWDPVGFADPAALRDTLGRLGFRSVAILDPGLPVIAGDAIYEQGTRGDHWVKTAGGETFVGPVWPGACAFPDFTRAATRAWWSELVAAFVARRVDGVWNDMNEPAVFGTPNKSMPETNRHDADAALGGPDSHARYHNVYGMLMARASFEGCLRARPDARPFVLSRANFLGGQRWAAAWTGDNRASWSHLRVSVPMSLSLGLSGQPFSGPDLGGFAGTTSGELYARWIGVGALFPFARAHSEKGTPRREPWSFGSGVERTARRALETRMRLLPYLYTCFEAASHNGVPVMRPVFFAAPADPSLRAEDESFLLGDDLLVEAHLDSSRARPVRPISERLGSPRAPWRRVNVHGTSEALADPDLPALHLRPGAIVPIGPILQHVDERALDEVELLVSLDSEGHAAGTLYEDAGDGFRYRNGDFRRTRFEADLKDGTVRVKMAVTEGLLAAPTTRRFRVTVIGARNAHVEGP